MVDTTNDMKRAVTKLYRMLIAVDPKTTEEIDARSVLDLSWTIRNSAEGTRFSEETISYLKSLEEIKVWLEKKSTHHPTEVRMEKDMLKYSDAFLNLMTVEAPFKQDKILFNYAIKNYLKKEKWTPADCYFVRDVIDGINPNLAKSKATLKSVKTKMDQRKLLEKLKLEEEKNHMDSMINVINSVKMGTSFEN